MSDEDKFKIYRISFLNGKNYIGKTEHPIEKRHREHKCLAKNGDTRCLYKALRKYNMIDTFELEVIDTADTSDELCDKEIAYIQMYNSHYDGGRGYNMTYGGEGSRGYIYTEEDKQRAREAQTNYFKNNPKAKEKHIERLHRRFKENPNAGKEHAEKMKKYYDEHPEAIETARERTIAQFEIAGAREKASEAQKKRFENQEERDKNSEAQKKRFERPGEIEKLSEAATKRHARPGEKEKLLNQRGKNKPFDVFTNDGTFIKTFTYQFEAKEYLQKEYNITKNIDISCVLCGRQKSCAGFIFKYK